VVGYGSFSLCVIHKEGLCSSSGDINRLMMKVYIGTEKFVIVSGKFVSDAALMEKVKENSSPDYPKLSFILEEGHLKFIM
jgi:hypothetical protein